MHSVQKSSHCKSCNVLIAPSDLYCHQCGGKVVDGPLSLKGTWGEFIEPFFSWDNNYWKTTLHLLTKPEKVLRAYISGARKKYFKPFPYLIVLATITVFFYKFFDFSEIDNFTAGFTSGLKGYPSAEKLPEEELESLKNVRNRILNNYNFFVILGAPIAALSTFLTFFKKGNNYFEHLVFQAYIQSIVGYSSLLLQAIIIFALGLQGDYYMLSYLLFSTLYYNYAFHRLYNHSIKQTLLAFLRFLLILVGLTLALVLVSSILGKIIKQISSLL